jgi:hypothetical protein
MWRRQYLASGSSYGDQSDDISLIAMGMHNVDLIFFDKTTKLADGRPTELAMRLKDMRSET